MRRLNVLYDPESQEIIFTFVVYQDILNALVYRFIKGVVVRYSIGGYNPGYSSKVREPVGELEIDLAERAYHKYMEVHGEALLLPQRVGKAIRERTKERAEQALQAKAKA